jgi:peptidoglycan hydrolase CwlO-like protein
MFQELIKIAEEVYVLDKQLGIRLGKCLESLGKKITEHNEETKATNVKIRKLENKIKSFESAMRRRMH